MISRSDQRSQARLRSASGLESAAWLDALPSSNALSVSPAEFRIAALLRLGAEIPFLRDIDHCDCGAAIDNDGYHTLTCARGSGAVRRHNAIQHTWINLLHSVNYLCDLEREHQFDDDNKRPDIGVFNFKDGRKLLLDVSVIHPQSGSVLARGACSDGAAAAKREEDKLAKYLDDATRLGYLFEPLVFEVFGRWSPIGKRLFSQFSLRPSLDFLDHKNAFMDFWR